jgi:glycosyltransferase involved in cell wall biosynthesis
VNAMGDPWDALGPGTWRSLLRPVYRRIATRNMRSICSHAHAALYWSRAIIQRYPVSRNGYSAVAPRIALPSGYASTNAMHQRAIRARQRSRSGPSNEQCLRLGFMGSLEQLYKGPDILLRAVSICSRTGLNLKVLLAGAGRYREALESLARSLSVQNMVVFLGQVGFGKPVFDFLDSLDLFVMPSRAEGLPRSLVEAMACGCPCIASDIGGIPELLHSEDLVAPGNPDSLAAKILEVTANPERLIQMSLRNLERAKEFDPDTLRNIRQNFYSFVKLQAGVPSARGKNSIIIPGNGFPRQNG